jgi:hypothetical protein
MAPLRLPKVAFNRFLVFRDKIKSEKTEKKYLFLVAARTLTLWVRSMLGAPWRNKTNTFSSGRCAVDVFCSKMAPLRLPKVAFNRFLAFRDKTKSEKTEKKYLFLVAARTLTLWVRSMLGAPWRNKKYTFCLGWCAVVVLAVKWLPCGCQKLHSTVFWHLETKSKVKKPKELFIPCCDPYPDALR